jgi:hypothetical protein
MLSVQNLKSLNAPLDATGFRQPNPSAGVLLVELTEENYMNPESWMRFFFAILLAFYFRDLFRLRKDRSAIRETATTVFLYRFQWSWFLAFVVTALTDGVCQLVLPLFDDR